MLVLLFCILSRTPLQRRLVAESFLTHSCSSCFFLNEFLFSAGEIYCDFASFSAETSSPSEKSRENHFLLILVTFSFQSSSLFLPQIQGVIFTLFSRYPLWGPLELVLILSLSFLQLLPPHLWFIFWKCLSLKLTTHENQKIAESCAWGKHSVVP